MSEEKKTITLAELQTKYIKTFHSYEFTIGSRIRTLLGGSVSNPLDTPKLKSDNFFDGVALIVQNYSGENYDFGNLMKGIGMVNDFVADLTKSLGNKHDFVKEITEWQQENIAPLHTKENGEPALSPNDTVSRHSVESSENKNIEYLFGRRPREAIDRIRTQASKMGIRLEKPGDDRGLLKELI